MVNEPSLNFERVILCVEVLEANDIAFHGHQRCRELFDLGALRGCGFSRGIDQTLNFTAYGSGSAFAAVFCAIFFVCALGITHRKVGSFCLLQSRLELQAKR